MWSHHELRQPQSDACWTSEDETRNVKSVVLARHETEAHVLLENCDLLMHTVEMWTHQRLPDCHQTVQEVLGHLSEQPTSSS